MASAKPKDIELPKFSDEKREEKKPTARKEAPAKVKEKNPVVEEPAIKEEPKAAPEVNPAPEVKKEEPAAKEEPKVEKQPEVAPIEEKGKKGKKQKDPLNSNVFIPNQKILGGWRFFFPYFFRLVYFLALIVCSLAIFVLPVIQLKDGMTTPFPGEDSVIPFADAVSRVKDTNAIFGIIYSIAHGIVPDEGLFSIVDIVFVNLAPILSGNIDPMGIIGVAGSLYCVVLFIFVLLIELIWFTIKLVTSIIGFIFFWVRKGKKIDNFYYKNTKGLYSLGLLNWDYTFIAALLMNGLIWAGMNFKIPGIVLFDAVFNENMMNNGNIALIVSFGILFAIRLLYRLSVILLSKKVKKTYVRKLNYRALKKAAKNGEEIH